MNQLPGGDGNSIPERLKILTVATGERRLLAQVFTELIFIKSESQV